MNPIHCWTILALTAVASLTSNVAAVPVQGEDLCVVGCTPYVDPAQPSHGMDKFRALAADMAASCGLIVHVGDTKPGRNMGCNRTIMTNAIHILKDEGAPILLYAPGDNEINDCHRLQLADDPTRRYPTEITRAEEARQFLIDDLGLNSGKDITQSRDIEIHSQMNHLDNPASCDEFGTNCGKKYSCDFDKYIEMTDYAVATLEVLGSHWYLDDERNSGYSHQDSIDPLKDRLALFVNAKDCALHWIEQTAQKAHESGKKAVFFMLHATFYAQNGVKPLGFRGIGEYYKPEALRNYTRRWKDPVGRPYLPLFEKFRQVSLQYKDINFQIVHSDAHRWLTTRFNPSANNNHKIHSHHNMMIHQTEGASRALTMYSRFTVDALAFQPITIKEEWSRNAYDIVPVGHSWIPYQPPS